MTVVAPEFDAENVSYIFPDGSVHTLQDLSNKIMADLGLNGIGYRGRTAAEAFQGIGVYPEDYGAINLLGSSFDSTDFIHAAFAAAKELGRPLIWPGNYSATHVDFDQPNGMTFVCGGTLTGLSTGDPNGQESVISFRNFNDFRMYGRLVVSARYRIHYAAAVAIYSDNGAGASQWKIDGLTTVAAQLGTRIGRRSEPDALISECTLSGCDSVNCPTAFEVIGTQTVVNLSSVNAVSGAGHPPADAAYEWGNLPRTGIRNFGASVNMKGGQALITDVITGLLFDNRPIASPLVGNRYGKIDATTTIESASPVCRFWNPEGIGSLVSGSGSVTLHNCDGYHSQNIAPLIQCENDFTGKITATHNTMYFTGVRTVPNVLVGSASCDIVVDEHSFGKGLMKGFDSVIGGRLSFGYQKIVDVYALFQSIASGDSTAPLAFQIKPNTPGNNRFAVGYNTITGVFTVPDGGLKSVHVSLSLDQGAPRPNSKIVVNVDGYSQHFAGANGERFINASWDLGDLAAGSQIQIYYKAGIGTSQFYFSPSTQDRMSISARA